MQQDHSRETFDSPPVGSISTTVNANVPLVSTNLAVSSNLAVSWTVPLVSTMVNDHNEVDGGKKRPNGHTETVTAVCNCSRKAAPQR
jgi:hypothetical protein